jgi:hypothetical protein
MFDREYDEGDVIIRQGDEGDNFYVRRPPCPMGHDGGRRSPAAAPWGRRPPPPPPAVPALPFSGRGGVLRMDEAARGVPDRPTERPHYDRAPGPRTSARL